MSNIHIARSQQHLGSFIEAEVREGIRSGRFAPEDLVWKEGMEAWKSLGEMASQWGMEIPPPPLGATGSVETWSESPNPVIDSQEPAWEQREQLGPFPAMMQTIRAVLFRPVQTFACLKHTGGLTSPLLYALILNTTLYALTGLISLISLLMMTPQEFMSGWQLIQEQFQSIQELYPGFQLPAQPFFTKSFYEYYIGGSILLWPLIGMIGYFLGAGLMHLSLMMVGGARRPFETTFRTSCYLCGSFNALTIMLLNPGGILGSMIFLILLLGYLCWYSYAAVMAFKEAQGIAVWRVVVAATIANVMGCCLVFGVSLIISPVVMAMMGMSGKMGIR